MPHAQRAFQVDALIELSREAAMDRDAHYLTRIVRQPHASDHLRQSLERSIGTLACRLFLRHAPAAHSVPQ